MMNDNNTRTNSGGFYTNNQIGYGVVLPNFSVMDAATPPPLLHMYDDSDFFHSPTRKRSRSTYYHHHHHQIPISSSSSSLTTTNPPSPFSFLGQDINISSHINQQQHEIDRFLSLHMERMKMEMEERRKKQARTIMEAVIGKRLRAKEEERDRIGKINNALEERVKSLSMENQIWRELAQTNEATANNLRNNLEQVLSQVKMKEDEDDDAESCCGSSLIAATEEEKGGKKCKNCGEGESCVLLLPCRHLCLCGVCGSTVHTCPICTSPKNASVHLNMSSSS